jgi:cysteine desulfurase
MLFLFDQHGISVSAGSACQAGVIGASHVLLAMGYSEAESSSVVRITLGHSTKPSDIDQFTSSIADVYATALKAGLNR